MGSLENGDSKHSTNSPWRYVIGGVVSGLFIALFLYVADRYGSVWGALIATIPISLIVATFFLPKGKSSTFIFALMLGTVAFLLANVIYVLLLKCSGLNPGMILGISIIVWAIAIWIIYSGFWNSLQDHPLHCLDHSSSPYLNNQFTK